MNNYCKYGENSTFADRWVLIIKQNHVNNFLKIVFVIIEVDVIFSHKREYYNSTDVSYLKC